MNDLKIDPAFDAGLRNLLLETAVPQKRRRRAPLIVGVTLASVSVFGAVGAYAAGVLTPGQDIVTTLGSAQTVTGNGPMNVRLESAPSGTNSLEYSVSCLSAGTIRFPDGSSVTCSAADVGAHVTTATDSLDWKPGVASFALDTSPTMPWALRYTFSSRVSTALQTNAAGQTYGVDTASDHPDLIAVVATNGRQGYISAKEEASVDCSGMHSPAEAIKCSSDHDGKVTSIPVYESDGKTKVGTFTIG